MAIKKGGLGKGLDSMIPDKIGKVSREQAAAKADTMLDITKVEPNRQQPRRNFDEDSLLELAESMKQFGVLQPLLVQDRKTYYEIIAGERRWRAAKLAGLKKIPVIIKNYSEQEIVEISLIENIQRQDLNPIEEALAYKRLLTEFHLKQDEIAERVSKSRTAVTNSMRLLKLNENVQQMLIDDMISTGHARALLALENAEQQFSLAQRIFDEKLSVREVEKIVKKMQSAPQQDQKATPELERSLEQMRAVYHDLEEQMKGIFGTKVSINSRNMKKGKIEIAYYSPDELEHIIDLIKSLSS